jgi:hypothetical protein
MSRIICLLVSAMFALGLAAPISATEIVQPEAAVAPSDQVPNRVKAIDFCDSSTSGDGLFQLVSADQICIASALKGASPKETVALSAIAQAYLTASRPPASTRLPEPLRTVGRMVAGAVYNNTEARNSAALNPTLPRPSLLAAREFTNDDGSKINWAANGLALAQAAGSCEAITVTLFKRIAGDATFSANQRLEARHVVRGFGMAAFQPDERCVSSVG